LPLSGGFEEEFVHFSRGQALGQVVEGAMLIPAMVAGAIGFATAGETLDQGGAQGIREDLDLGNQKAFAPAQGQGGLASGGMNPRHIYGEVTPFLNGVNGIENALKIRKCSIAAISWR
jgi:hypothetical protein